MQVKKKKKALTGEKKQKDVHSEDTKRRYEVGKTIFR